MESSGKDHGHGLPLVLQPRAEPVATLVLGAWCLVLDVVVLVLGFGVLGSWVFFGFLGLGFFGFLFRFWGLGWFFLLVLVLLFFPTSAAQVHREFAPWEQHAQGRRRAPHCAAGPAPAAEARRGPRAATRLPPGGWVLPELGRVLHLVPTSGPLPSSVSVEPSGAFSRQGPRRSTAAHAAKQHAVVALSDAVQLLNWAAS